MECRNCGDEVDPARVEAGYDYCVKAECQARCVQKVLLASVAVNKAADYYSRADEVLAAARPPAPAPRPVPGEEEAPPSRRPAAVVNRAPISTLAQLQALESRLDHALDQIYGRFQRGELTAKEMERRRSRLVEAFNRRVRSENIRYRSMLRPS